MPFELLRANGTSSFQNHELDLRREIAKTKRAFRTANIAKNQVPHECLQGRVIEAWKANSKVAKQRALSKWCQREFSSFPIRSPDVQVKIKRIWLRFPSKSAAELPPNRHHLFVFIERSAVLGVANELSTGIDNIWDSDTQAHFSQ